MSLEQRVARLERLVARLLEQSGEPTPPATSADEPRHRREHGPESWSWAGASGEPSAAGEEATQSASAGAPSPASAAGLADHGERWLGRVGVAFLVLAFGFFFRYAFDQGWIGPSLRLLLGLLASTAMLTIGLRLEGSRERYSQYLLGGSIAIYYLVGFASYELYELVPFALAFAFMFGVTALAFVLADRRRLASLAVIGAGGGLSTPFLVSTGSTDVPALVVYTTLILAGAGSIQFLRGWRVLLLVLGFGGFAVMGFAVGLVSDAVGTVERVVVLAGVLAAWSLFGAFPLVRTSQHRLEPVRWPEPSMPSWSAHVAPPARVALWLLRVGCVAGATLAVIEVGALVSVERATVGLLFGLGSLVYLALARGFLETRLALNAAAETASILLVLAVTLFFFDYRVMLPLAVAGAGMHLADKQWGLPGVAVLAHILMAQLMIVVVSRANLTGNVAGSPFGFLEVGALGAIALVVSTSFGLQASLLKRVYRIAAHIAFLAWLVTQFRPMTYGQELISLSWGVYGIVLLLLSLRLGQRGVQLAGLATLGLVAAKLLLVDMAQVDVIWRILLFMGFGAAFLWMSYLINRQAGHD